MEKYLQTLGLQEGASQEEIKEAYDRISKELDPTNNDNQEFFIEEYKKVQEAYEALSNSSILASAKVKIENKPKINKSSKNKNQKTNLKEKKKSFFTKENIILVLLIFLVGHSFYLQIKVSETIDKASSASSNARRAYNAASDASSYAQDASSYAQDAYNAASDASSYAYDAYYSSFGNQCSYCP
jgi:curved DNA-binding protein CbpA